jgi:hypothetical protein
VSAHPKVILQDHILPIAWRLMSMRGRTEIAVAVAITAFVWISLFDHSLPIPVQSVLFVVVLLLAPVMLVIGWWRFRKAWGGESFPRWRKICGLVALIASSLTFALPILVFFYAVALFQLRLQPSRWMVNWLIVLPVCLALSLCGIIGGILAPPRIRLSTALSGLIAGSIVLSIPIGIL